MQNSIPVHLFQRNQQDTAVLISQFKINPDNDVFKGFVYILNHRRLKR